MGVSILGRASGSGAMHYKGYDFWAKDVAAFELDLGPTDVPSNAFGSLSTRATRRIVKGKFTPVGQWTLAMLAILFPYQNPRYGDYNTPVRTVSAINTGTNALTSAGHGQVTGTGMRLGVLAGGTLPTGLTANMTYYIWASPDGATILLFDTEAHAMASDGVTILTGQITGLSAIASGTVLKFIVNSPLTITTLDGMQLVVWNAAITKQPDLMLGPTETPIGEVEFEGYTLHGMNWGDNNSVFAESEGQALNAVPPNQAQIPTTQYTADWVTRLMFTQAAVSTANNTITLPNHGLTTAQAIEFEAESANGTLPGGITNDEALYAIFVDGNTIKVATSSGNATAGTAITITSAGSGTFSIVPTGGIQMEGIVPADTVKVTQDITWSELKSQNGVDCRRLTGFKATAALKPTNLPYATLLAALGIQGGSSAPGQALPFANLDIYGPNYSPFVRVYGATLQNVPARVGTDADRVDTLNFIASTRQFRGNVQQPIVSVGTAAPTS